MAIGVDTSKWKPRKITGTPANKVRNIIGASLISIGLLIGVYFHVSPWTQGLRKSSEKLYEDPIEDVERRILIGSGLRIRSGTMIRRLKEEEERIDRPDK